VRDFIAKLTSTLIAVVVAVGVSGGVWIVANLLVNRLRDASSRATVVGRALVGFLIAGVLSGNRLTEYSTVAAGTSWWRAFAQWLWLPLVTALNVVVIATIAERSIQRSRRIVVYVIACAALGGALAALLIEAAHPRLVSPATYAVPFIMAAVFAAFAAITRRPRRLPATLRGALLGIGLGLVAGAWGFNDLGSGVATQSIGIGSAVGGCLGAFWALAPGVSAASRFSTERRARAAVFLAPALGFIAVALVIPSLRTIYLSFLDRKSNNFVGLDNYFTIFRDSKSWDMSRIGSLMTSRLTITTLIFLVVFVLLAIRGRRRTGHYVEFGSPSMTPLALAVLFGGFAVFSTLRGTLVNNLWWVFAVTSFSTIIGLLIAVLADGVKFERIAKAIIFMPLAISMVGASVIWRIVYISRDSSKPQSGTLNGLWVGVGRLSTGEGLGRVALGLVVLVPTVLGLLMLIRALVRREWSRITIPAAVFGLGTWFSLRYWQVVGTGLGGHQFDESGQFIADPINFLQESPFNNFWLMVVLIWTQVGFAMVIFAAAIRAVPHELTDAARVDGADTRQTFWQVTLPQIAPTIGVVATTIMVLVMKVFDIAKVMTNGNFGTEVLANNMYREAFYNLNIGLGAALAVLIFVSVIPIIYINIRRMTRVA
jgi:alpha-glucoside transport system permease protein